MRLNIKNILSKNWFVLVLIAIGVFLRTYRLTEFVTFLGDQGRDAIIIKRIITFEHFPAIGPTSSVGGVFLGPFYYYLMAPFLALFHLDPIGLAYGSVFFSIIGFIAAYFVVRKELDKPTAIFFSIFTIFSYILVESARFSWNPNLLPFFSFFTLYFAYKFVAAKKNIYALLTGVFLSFSIQLHYLSLLLFVPIICFFIINHQNKKKSIISQIPSLMGAFVSFVFFSAPLIIFDLKHDFLNTKSFIKIFTDQKVVAYSSPLNRLLETNSSFLSYVFNFKINIIIAIVILIGVGFYFYKNSFFKRNIFLQLHFLNFISFILFFSLFNSFRLPHYYMQIYLSFFLILAYMLTRINKTIWLKIVSLFILIFFVFFNAKKYPFNAKEGNFQIWRAKIIAQSIIDRDPQLPYQIVPIPFTEMDGHIRYFLEILGKTPLSEESSLQPKELYVLCYEKECTVRNHPQWQIAAFKNKEVEKTWKIDRVKIYKLVHGK